MYLRLRYLVFLFVFFGLTATAQTDKNTGVLKGTLLKTTSQQPAPDIQLIIPQLKLATLSDAEGKFIFSNVAYGTYQMVVSGTFAKNDTMSVTIDGPVADLGNINVMYNDAAVPPASIEIPTIAMDETNLSTEDEGISTQNVSSVLNSGKDPFINAISYTFGSFWFRPRGYDRAEQTVLVNGAIMNDAETGDAFWSQWGGLNDVFRSRSNTYGLEPSEYAYGGLTGTTNFDATALNQRKQTRVSYALSNRIYRNKLSVTHSSGLMKNGWAYSLSFSKRWAKEGYVPGTFYDGYSYYAAVSKVYKKHQFDFTAFGTPTRRGKAAPTTQEADNLAGTNFYNPNWGYQNGEKRNAKVNQTFQPAFILNHEYKPNSKTRWSTALSYQFGKQKNSTLDWYNAADPRPDYYRYLPSYYQYGPNPNVDIANAIAERLKSDPDHNLQIDWDRIYNTNYMNTETIHDANGIAGNDVTGKRSLYVLSNYVDDLKKWAFNTNLERQINEHISVYGGLSFISQQTESYKELQDLLGGDFYVNLNQFTSRNLGGGVYTQNNLDNPNGIIHEGDKYGYDYIKHLNKGTFWAQGIMNYNKFDFFLSGKADYTSFYREGLFRNGLYPTISEGNSAKQNFLTLNLKGGATYKINGRNFLFVNAGIGANPPELENTYVSLNIRNTTIDHPVAEKYQTIEGGYLLKAPKVNARVVVYATDITDATKLQRYYNNDPNFQSFTDFIIQGMNMRFIGTELALNVKLTSTFDVTGVASLAQAFYTNNPSVSVYGENDTVTTAGDVHTVYLSNYSLANGPQSAYTLGLNYRSKDYWYASMNFNYIDRNYVDVAPDRRSEQAADLIQPGSDLWHKIFDQEKAPSVFTIDLFAGYSWKLSRLSRKLGNNSFLYVSVGVNNLLNNQKIINLGFEQLRYDFSANEPNKFDNKYFYGYGTNFFASVSLKF